MGHIVTKAKIVDVNPNRSATPLNVNRLFTLLDEDYWPVLKK